MFSHFKINFYKIKLKLAQTLAFQINLANYYLLLEPKMFTLNKNSNLALLCTLQTQHEHMSDAGRTLIEVIFQCTTTTMIQSISWSFWSLKFLLILLSFFSIISSSSRLVHDLFFMDLDSLTTCTTTTTYSSRSAQWSKNKKKLCSYMYQKLFISIVKK